MAAPGEVQRAPDPAENRPRRIAEALSVGLLEGRRGRIAWANTTLAELAGEKASCDLEGRALDTLVMDAGGGVPDWVSSGAVGRAVECWLLRREKDPLTVAVRCLGGGEAPGDGWWEVQDLTPLRAARGGGPPARSAAASGEPRARGAARSRRAKRQTARGAPHGGEPRAANADHRDRRLQQAAALGEGRARSPRSSGTS